MPNKYKIVLSNDGSYQVFTVSGEDVTARFPNLVIESNADGQKVIRNLYDVSGNSSTVTNPDQLEINAKIERATSSLSITASSSQVTSWKKTGNVIDNFVLSGVLKNGGDVSGMPSLQSVIEAMSQTQIDEVTDMEIVYDGIAEPFSSITSATQQLQSLSTVTITSVDQSITQDMANGICQINNSVEVSLVLDNATVVIHDGNIDLRLYGDTTQDEEVIIKSLIAVGSCAGTFRNTYLRGCEMLESAISLMRICDGIDFHEGQKVFIGTVDMYDGKIYVEFKNNMHGNYGKFAHIDFDDIPTSNTGYVRFCAKDVDTNSFEIPYALKIASTFILIAKSMGASVWFERVGRKDGNTKTWTAAMLIYGGQNIEYIAHDGVSARKTKYGKFELFDATGDYLETLDAISSSAYYINTVDGDLDTIFVYSEETGIGIGGSGEFIVEKADYMSDKKSEMNKFFDILIGVNHVVINHFEYDVNYINYFFEKGVTTVETREYIFTRDMALQKRNTLDEKDQYIYYLVSKNITGTNILFIDGVLTVFDGRRDDIDTICELLSPSKLIVDGMLTKYDKYYPCQIQLDSSIYGYVAGDDVHNKSVVNDVLIPLCAQNGNTVIIDGIDDIDMFINDFGHKNAFGFYSYVNDFIVDGCRRVVYPKRAYVNGSMPRNMFNATRKLLDTVFNIYGSNKDLYYGVSVGIKQYVCKTFSISRTYIDDCTVDIMSVQGMVSIENARPSFTDFDSLWEAEKGTYHKVAIFSYTLSTSGEIEYEQLIDKQKMKIGFTERHEKVIECAGDSSYIPESTVVKNISNDKSATVTYTITGSQDEAVITYVAVDEDGNDITDQIQTFTVGDKFITKGGV